MTDALAQSGPHGSEVLANGMRQVFEPMIRSVLEYGGHVVGFAGDAITALFPVTESAREDAYKNAITAALNIQEHRRENAIFSTPYGKFSIAVKIGLGQGDTSWRIVSSTDGKRATYYFRGSAIDSAVLSLSLSNPGESILHSELHQAFGKTVNGQFREGHLLLTEFFGERPAPKAFDLHPPHADHLRVFCSDDVGSHDLTGEFRPAVNLFIGLLQETEQEIQLEEFIQQVFILQDRYGGLFSRVDIGDKGTNLLMFWGAPIVQENDVERALNFLMELLEKTNLPMKAGITYRMAYAGYMGGSLQEEYTCYGWGVSLSARLMTIAAPGEILADEEIARRAERQYHFQHAGRQTLKGFSKPQDVFKLVERKEDDRAVFSGIFVGRESELKTLTNFIGPIWSGDFAGMLTIYGEPGIGKSRLAQSFQKSKIFSEKDVHWAICQTDEIIRQSLNPFRYWLKRFFNLSETMDEAQSKQAFDLKLDELIASTPDPNLAQNLNRTRSFLGELVNLHWLDSLYDQLDAQGRFDNTFIALSTLLRAEGLRQPIILLIEDTHRLDSDSRTFLPYLERSLLAEIDKQYPIAILATSRREGPEVKLELTESQEINLAQLGSTDLSQLAEGLVGGRVSPSLLKVLELRAEGNPFFVEQIIRYLQDGENLEQGAHGWQIVPDRSLGTLPTDINAILISRLDSLNQKVKEVVQTASVLGREFELRMLSRMLKEIGSQSEGVSMAVEAGIFSILSEIRYIFLHALLRDTAYNMQLQARRQELHRIALEAFETIYQENLSPHYNEIAYHAEHAGLKEKAKKFYILAGQGAAQAYQNNQAINSYTRALALSSIKNIQERIDLLFARVALYRIIGDRSGQEQDLATLEFLAKEQNNFRNRGLVALRQAYFAFDSGNFQEAQRLAESAIKFAESVDALDVVSSAYRTLPLALARQGQTAQAILAAQTGLPLTQQMGDRESEGQTLNQLGLIMIEQHETEQAHAYFTRGLELARESGNRRLEAQVLNNMGVLSGMIENDYSNASILYEKTLEIVREIGNRVGEGHALGNLGWAASMQGDFEQAHKYYVGRLTIARETGNRFQEMYVMINLGTMMISQEIYMDALEYEEHALNLAHEIGDPSAEAWSLTFLGYANIGLGNFDEAALNFQKALEIRETLGQQTLALEPLAGLAQVYLKKNNLTGAFTYAERILLHLANGDTLEGTEEPLRIYLTIYLTLAKHHDPRTEQILEDAHALLNEQVGKIQEKTHKEMFVQNVPWRRQIDELWQQNQARNQQDT